MTLNKLLLGDNSVVDLTTKETVDEIKLKLASRYSKTRHDPSFRFPGELEDFSTKYIHFISKNEFKIYFSKDLNRKFVHNFSIPYPWFTGQIVDNSNHRQIKGQIEQHEWSYYFSLLWLIIFGFFSYKGLTSEAEGSDIPLYFFLIGLVTFLIGLVRTRNKVDEMRNEIDRVFSNAR